MSKTIMIKRPFVGSLALLFVGGCYARFDDETDHPSFPWDGGYDTSGSSGATDPTSSADSSSPIDTAPSDTAPTNPGGSSEPASSDGSTDTSERAGVWGPEIIIENTEADAENLQVTMDAAGNTLFAWLERNSQAGTAAVATRYFSRTTGWGPILQLANYPGGNTRDLKMCANEDGSVVLTWARAASTEYQAPASLFVAYYSSPEATPEPVELEDETLGSLVGCGIDDSGLGLLVWSTSAGVVFSRGEGPDWTTPEVIVETTGDYRVAMNPQGNAFLVGRHGSAGSESFSGVWYAANSGWGAPSYVPLSEPLDSNDFAVALGGDDIARLAWVATFPDYTGQVWTSPFTNDAGWGTPFRLDDNNEWGGTVTLSADHSGGALAVWTTYTPFLENRVRARRFTPGVGWDPSSSFIGEHGTSVSSTLGPTGYGLAAYRNADAIGPEASIEVVYFSPEGRSMPFVSQIPGGYDSVDPAVAVNAAGQAVVAWEHDDFGDSQARALFRD